MNKKAFTLVELIVVITILAILATIGFVSFSGYLAGTRDTNRVAQLKSMSDALELYSTKKILPIPDDKVEVKSSGSVIAYQGYIGKNVLETIEYTESGLDPKDKQYFSYYLTKNKKYFQLLAFLEEENQDVVAMNTGHTQGEPLQNNVGVPFMGTLNATDYSDKIPKTTGKKLGILADKNNIPIQELNTITSSGFIDLSNVGTEEYKAIISDEEIIYGTGTALSLSNPKASCKRIKQIKGGSSDGVYTIDPEANGIGFKVYCDMTTAGGGWTVLAKTGKIGTAGTTISEKCSSSYSIKDLKEEENDYLLHCNLGQKSFLVNQPGYGWFVGTKSKEELVGNCAINATITGMNKCPFPTFINTFSIKNKSDSLSSISPKVSWIYRVGNNNNYADNYIYLFQSADVKGIGNWTHSLSLEGVKTNTNLFGYIGVR